MAQRRFRDPIVSAGPTLTGTGNGTLTVDKLTHFTTAQDYTLTCIAKSPDTVFSIVGSLDGPVGLVKVGTQFFDEDLKIFLTIQQGGTAFEVGDKFELTVINGTDLNQDNIDDYDEEPQKNFGTGTKGEMSGDNNIRYSDSDTVAALYLQNLIYQAVASGLAGNDAQIEYLNFIPSIPSTGTIEDLTFTAVTGGTAGDSITVEYDDWTPPVKSELTIQDLTYSADVAGTGGDAISVRYTTTGTAGAENVSVLVNAITVDIQSGVSTATQIKAAVDSYAPAAALVDISISGTGSNTQTGPFGPTNLSGGADAIGEAGSEDVFVTGNAILVKAQSGSSTATQIKAALDASTPASALISTVISGTGSNVQTIPFGPQNLSGGVDSIGEFSPVVQVTGNLIQVLMNPGITTAQQIKTAIEADISASALVTLILTGPGDERQYSPIAATNLSGGNSKYYALNKHELTEPGSFLEGNASLLAEDLNLQGRLSVAEESLFSGKVVLENPANPVVPDLQQYMKWLIQDQKLTLRTADDSALVWAAPALSFSADIAIDFPDTDFENTIASSESPISIADGESVYVLLDRNQNAVVSTIIATVIPQEINAFRLASRFGDSLILWDNTLVRNGKSVRIGEGGGSGGGAVRIDLYDPVDTTLPSGPSATIDGVAVTNDMLVLFSNLISNNNRIYRSAGVGTSITWTPEVAFSTGEDAVIGDSVIPLQGEAFALTIGTFDGSDWKFNDRVRYFNGTDYWEFSSLNTAILNDNTTDDVFTLTLLGSENMIVDYSIIRGVRKETGSLHVTSDGTDVNVTTTGSFIGLSGITFFGDISGSDLRLRYMTDNSGDVTTMKYFVRRWSDNAGGPGGVPSYSGAGSSGVTAAGSNTEVQFNDLGELGADSDFTWDQTTNTLGLAGLAVKALSAAIVLYDNQSSPVTAFSFNATNYPFAIIEYSVLRDGKYRTGRIIVANDSSAASMSDDYVATGDTGITFLATISAGNVDVQYMSTNTTFNAQLKYSMRAWA